MDSVIKMVATLGLKMDEMNTVIEMQIMLRRSSHTNTFDLRMLKFNGSLTVTEPDTQD